MRRSKNKKKGSALIVVLSFALIFIVISAVSATVVVSTLRANAGEENYQSLYYYAEAGIEKVIAKANNDSDAYNSLELNKEGSFVEENITTIGNKVVDVKVTVRYVQDTPKGESEPSGRKYLLVESTATSKKNSNLSRTVKTKLSKYGNAANIFKYTICGEEVQLIGTGAINVQTARVNSSKKEVEINFTGDKAVDKLTKEEFELPEFDNSKFEENVGISIDLTAGTDVAMKAALDSYIGNGVRKLEAKYLKNGDYTVYIVNTPTLDININSEGNFTNTFILCDGVINLNILNKQSAQFTNYGIVGKKVIISEPSCVHVSYGAYLEDTNKVNVQYPFTEATINDIVQQISEYAPNYGVNTSSSGDSVYTPTDYF